MTAMETLQAIVWQWGARCFGEAHLRDTGVRALRLAEEAVELVQAAGVDKDQMIDLVNIVYSRPVGSIAQELGGVLVTTSVMCSSFDRTMEETMLTEVQRCLSKSPEHFAKRNDEKLRLGLTG